MSYVVLSKVTKQLGLELNFLEQERKQKNLLFVGTVERIVEQKLEMLY